MPDPSSVTFRMTCLAISSPNISFRASRKYSLNNVYLEYNPPSIATTVLFIFISLLLRPPVMPPLPSLPIFFKIPTMPAAANRAALRVTTSHTFTTIFLAFKGTSGISNISLRILATSLKSGVLSSCMAAIKGVLNFHQVTVFSSRDMKENG
ncbi:hypothetical protein V8G54_017471 [Vigna mungo]|uniref:Uncharacterized protein n=1 Tax=Vigna mungo TaxID=3915 RepID=A0AAQ3NN21_VIGMU